MIKPLSETEESQQEFVVVDIENEPSGKVIAVDTCWRNDQGKFEHFTCENWDRFWKWIVDRAGEDEKFRTLYAHNGGGWDWVSLAAWLMDSGKAERKTISIVQAGSRIIFMMVVCHKEFTIRFCDSMALLRSGLDSLGKVFFKQGKLDRENMLPHELLQKHPEKFYAYLHRDTELTVMVLEKTLELMREKVCKIPALGVTIGSTAMKVFRTMAVKQDISIPTDESVKLFLRKGYKGGRVEVFRYGYHPEIRVYDVNSLYPYAMKVSEVPISADGYWCKKLTLEKQGVWHVNFRQRNKGIPPILIIGGTGRYDGEGYFFSDELRLLREIDPSATIELKIGYVFRNCQLLFGDWVDKLYQLRLDYPDSAVSLLAKYLLNSCYGKFGQKSEREQLLVLESMDQLREKVASNKVRLIDLDRLIISEAKNVTCNHEHVGIAGIITSRARVELYKGMFYAGNRLVYCDTDSVHTSIRFPDNMVSSALGAFKLEFIGEGVYVGRKTYGLRDSSGKEKIRAKGVRVSKLRSGSVNFDDLCRISNEGAEIDTVYESNTTPLEALKTGTKVCAFGLESKTRKRKVRQT